ncbi:MAG: type VI secretion system contractile sheath large subunit [Rhodospirillales bacterium]|nr:type VI secretion system contractile sheath large subunit [Rhodospirillales bacterium]
MADEPPLTGIVERPLREAVLRGRFFGAGGAAERLAGFIAGTEGGLSAWFGPEGAARLVLGQDGPRGALDRDIAAIDRLLGEALDAVLHHPRLQALEGRWRGLAWLIGGIDPASRVKVKLLSLTWPELCRDLDRAAEFDQSQLFRKVYEEEFGSPGGEPYGLLVLDHEVRHRPGPGHPTDDVSALGRIASVAAAAFVPTVLSASPALFGVDRFGELSGVADPAAPFADAEHTRFRSLAFMEDARFLAVTLPRLLARAPWADDPARSDGFRYAEYAPAEEHRVWMSAGYAFAASAVRSFVAYGWPSDVRGVEPDQAVGGLVDDLPVEPFRTDPPGVAVPPPLDLVLADRQERALVDAGLMPLTAIPHGQEAVFGAVRSLQLPGRFAGAEGVAANANAQLSAQINAMLSVSRFAHYLKMLGRNMVGSFRTAEEIERALQAWLTGYVNRSSSAGPETRTRYPLAGGRVTVKERPGKPGVFGCIIHLQPHFQLDDVSATFRLVTELVAPGVR